MMSVADTALPTLKSTAIPIQSLSRLIRLQNEEDDCALDINQLQTHRDALLSQPQKLLPSGKSDPNQAAEIKDMELKIKLAQSRLAELREMREETRKNRKSWSRPEHNMP